MRKLIFLLGFSPLLLASSLYATLEEDEVGTRMASDATHFLDQLLGPGRANVVVSIQGERSEVRTQSEMLTPILKPAQAAPGSLSLPGYTQMITPPPAAPTEEEDMAKRLQYYQKDQEQSLRMGGFTIKLIRVSVVLDTSLSEAQVNTVRRLLPDYLHMDGQRGDVLTVLRAPLMPMWKRAFLSSEGIRSAAYFGVGAILVVLLIFWLSMTAYVIAMRSVKTFVREFTVRRGGGPQPMPIGPPPLTPGAALDNGPGGLPGLGVEDLAGDGEKPPLALGRRFDFLAAKEPSEVADLLGKEKPEDLALLFGYLADAHPDAATRIFSSLPIALQGEVSQALVHLSTTDPERLSMLENRIRTAVEFGVRGPERLGAILSRLPPQEREEILGEIMSRDAAGAEKVENSLFPFERIGELPAAELRRLLPLVPYAEWGIALRGAATDLVEAILAQLPVGPRAIVRDALEVQQPREKVMEARSKILSQVYDLAAKGQLTLSGRQGSTTEMM